VAFWNRKPAAERVPKDKGTVASLDPAVLAHLANFASTRVGVEIYVEPRTPVTEPTLVLVARSGEWTRRRVTGPRQAYAIGQKLNLPVYDANVVGYPSRMRAWTSARRHQKPSD
jgi:hypothetical protein